MAAQALKRWELENNIQPLDPETDAVFKYDSGAVQQQLQAKPWSREYAFLLCCFFLNILLFFPYYFFPHVLIFVVLLIVQVPSTSNKLR